MGNDINYIIPLAYLVPALIALVCAFIALRGGYAQKTWFLKKAGNDERVRICLIPFKEAKININSGEFNHIRIMNALFDDQKDAITIFTTELKGRSLVRVRNAWDEYRNYYEQNAKDQFYINFAEIHEPYKTDSLNELRAFLNKIIREVENAQ